MKMNWYWMVILVLALLTAAAYLYSGPRPGFDELYAKVDPDTTASLQTFRLSHPTRTMEANGLKWEYVILGQGPETVLFLHGMTGAYDIWWQQMEALADSFRVIALTYPAANSLGEMEQAVSAILKKEGVSRFHLVGSSLGGYFAQYLAARNPEKVISAVFANTFPPNHIIAEKNKTIGALLPYLPQWLVMNVLSKSMRESVYPASGNSELVLAFGLEQTRGRMSKAQVVGRYRCVIERFEPPDMAALSIPVMIIEAANDPLVEKVLREQLKKTYPTARVITFNNGHFPYLNIPGKYNAVLKEFLK